MYTGKGNEAFYTINNSSSRKIPRKLAGMLAIAVVKINIFCYLQRFLSNTDQLILLFDYTLI